MNNLKAAKLQLMATRRGILDPIDRFSEIIFGLIMVLTFTGFLSVGGESDARALFFAALSCNLAWGIVDAVMYLIARAVERARVQALGNAIRKEADPALARLCLRETISDTVNHLMDESDLDRLVERVRKHPPPERRNWLIRQDYIGALGVMLLVFLSTFPVAIPFLIFEKAHFAMRVSNGIALVMMFALGVSLARFTGQKFHTFGFLVMAVGVVLVLLTIVLGG